MATIEIEIDGKKITTEAGKSLIDVADEHGIYIPRFCYHKELSVAANCRMCLVEVEKARKPMPACATPVNDGMKVSTKSTAARHSQKAVMEFLLINHPLDCPICDQGGQCELQDLAMGYGHDSSSYDQPKHSVHDQDIGPLVATNMTRCIKCTRCVRFGQELAGLPELGLMGRGEEVEIGTYVQHFLQSEVSGNIIDLCPVGALLSKPFLYSARPWELSERQTIAAHDCLGSNTFTHTRRGNVMRTTPRHNPTINDIWLSDRDRFSYLGTNSTNRLTAPLIKNGDKWQRVSWQRAFKIINSRMKTILKREGGEQLGALISPSASTESCYLLQKLLRALDSNNIDHRLRQTDLSDQNDLPLYLGIDSGQLEKLSQSQCVLLIGSDIRQEQPLAAMKLRQAVAHGGKVIAVNVLDCPTHFPLASRWTVAPNDMLLTLGQIIKSLFIGKENISESLIALVAQCKPSDRADEIAELLNDTDQPLILLGELAHNHPEAAKIRQLALIISQLCGARIGFMTAGANSTGAAIAGALPHRSACGKVLTQISEDKRQQGLSAVEMIEQGLKIYLTVGIEPELDCANSQAAIASLKRAGLTICLTPYCNETMKQYANVILPMATSHETAGTFVNVEGEWQRFHAATRPKGEARPAWKILRVLANQLGVSGFDYNDCQAIYEELHEQFKRISPELSPPRHIQQPTTIAPVLHYDSRTLQRISQVPLYRTDAVVRHADALQQNADESDNHVKLHPNTAAYHHLQNDDQARVTQDDHSVILTVAVDERVPENCLWVNDAIAATIGLGGAFTAIDIEAVETATMEAAQ
ncbi:MAG: NADH-quinone oxidoreductase subunit G [Gammaproteobacteria bacterium]|nr:NADH-quinone oxidoreductase subunit G [Gammaproteobacteria bacterium]